MHDHHIKDMVRKLGPVFKDNTKAERILKNYWRDKIALVWVTEDVHRAANELELALTERKAVQVLQTLLQHHNAQYGIKWEDLTTHIQDKVLGRKLTKAEIHRFVAKDIITINQ